MSRLEALEELAEALRPQVLAEHSEHGLQGVSGLVGQYRATLAEIDELRAKAPDEKGTVLDELAKRRVGKTQAPRSGRAAQRKQRRG